MTDNQETKQPVTSLPGQPADSFIAEKPLGFYWRASRFFIFLLAALPAVGIIFDLPSYSRWLAVAVVFVLFNAWLRRRLRIKTKTAVAAGIFCGIAAGWLLAIFEIIWYHQWWHFLNLIRDPVMIGLAGAVVGLAFGSLLQNFNFFNINKTRLEPSGRAGDSYSGGGNGKGGGIYDRKTNVNDRFR